MAARLQPGGGRVINLPGGEAYIAPYEGEIEGQPSRTNGYLPIIQGFELLILHIEGNQVTEVIGEGPATEEMRVWIEQDSARRNLAELGLGCNDRAEVSGIVFEEAKAFGLHLALGRSDYIGGAV